MLQQWEKGGNVRLQRGTVFLNKHVSLIFPIPLSFFFCSFLLLSFGLCLPLQKGLFVLLLLNLFSSASTSSPLHCCHCSSDLCCTYIFPHTVPQHMPPLVFKCNTASILLGCLHCCSSQGLPNSVSYSRLQLTFRHVPWSPDFLL